MTERISAKNKELLLDACFMRLEGFSFSEIAKKHGVSQQRVFQMVSDYIASPDQPPRNRYRGRPRVIYPHIRDYMERRRMYLSELADVCGVSRSTLTNQLYGKSRLSAENLRKLMDLTSLSAEEIMETDVELR